MSVIALATLKRHLRVTHDAFDDDLQLKLDAAEDLALRYLNREDFPFTAEDTVSEESETSSSPDGDAIAPAVVQGVLLLAQSVYDPLEPAQREGLERSAYNLLHPYRLRLGV